MNNINIECTKNKLSEALKKVERITGKNLSLPVLECVLLVAEKNTLTLRSTNLELGIEIKIPVKVAQEGTVAVPGATLAAYVSGIKDDKVNLEQQDNLLIVSSDNHQTKINTQPVDDFPTIPQVVADYQFEIGVDKLEEGFRSVLYAASPGSMKPELSSVFVYGNGGVVFVATDTFRLAEKEINQSATTEFFGVLLPYKNVVEISRVLSGGGEVEVLLTENQIAFLQSEVYLTSRLLEGNFPDYKQIIPKEFTTEVKILKQDLVDILKMSNIFVDKLNKINIKVESDNKISITSKNTEVGEYMGNISGVVDGEPIEQVFNARNLSDCLASITTDSVLLSFSGVGKPMVIKGVNDNSFLYLVSPMSK